MTGRAYAAARAHVAYALAVLLETLIVLAAITQALLRLPTNLAGRSLAVFQVVTTPTDTL
jgi:hypothetical protein